MIQGCDDIWGLQGGGGGGAGQVQPGDLLHGLCDTTKHNMIQGCDDIWGLQGGGGAGILQEYCEDKSETFTEF